VTKKTQGISSVTEKMTGDQGKHRVTGKMTGVLEGDREKHTVTGKMTGVLGQ
jgi:hypothetical protein